MDIVIFNIVHLVEILSFSECPVWMLIVMSPWLKKQRVGNTGTFVSTQLNNVPLGSLMQYQLEITNNTPSGVTLGGTVVNLPFNDTLPVSLKNVSIVGTPATTQGTGGSSPVTTSCTPTLTGDDNQHLTVSLWLQSHHPPPIHSY